MIAQVRIENIEDTAKINLLSDAVATLYGIHSLHYDTENKTFTVRYKTHNALEGFKIKLSTIGIKYSLV